MRGSILVLLLLTLLLLPGGSTWTLPLLLKRSMIDVHLGVSEARHLKRSIPHPKADLSKNKIAS